MMQMTLGTDKLHRFMTLMKMRFYVFIRFVACNESLLQKVGACELFKH